VVLAFVVRHVSDLSAVLRETRRILCPGGRLACVTWHASGRSPLTGLAFDAMRRQAWLSDEEQSFLEDIDSRASQLPDVATAAGLSPLLVEDLHDERWLPDADEWWNGITGSSVGLGRLLDPRPPAERRRLRESFYAAAEVFRASDGLRIPVAARILVANKR
jgi:SAM-dependent methyltransferase